MSNFSNSHTDSGVNVDFTQIDKIYRDFKDISLALNFLMSDLNIKIAKAKARNKPMPSLQILHFLQNMVYQNIKIRDEINKAKQNLQIEKGL